MPRRVRLLDVRADDLPRLLARRPHRRGPDEGSRAGAHPSPPVTSLSVGWNGHRDRWLRPLVAGLIALLLLLLTLYALDRAGSYVTASDVYAAIAASIVAGAVIE